MKKFNICAISRIFNVKYTTLILAENWEDAYKNISKIVDARKLTPAIIYIDEAKPESIIFFQDNQPQQTQEITKFSFN